MHLGLVEVSAQQPAQPPNLISQKAVITIEIEMCDMARHDR